MNNKSVVCTVDISTGHYTWLDNTATVPTQPTRLIHMSFPHNMRYSQRASYIGG